jgi:site-specific recombinase XerC
VNALNKARQAENPNAPPVEDWAPNRIRHTAGTEVRKKFGLEAAQVVLGHAQADVTQIYAEADWKLAEKVVRRIG